MKSIKNKKLFKSLVDSLVEWADEIGAPPLWMACKLGDKKTVDRLLKAGVDIEEAPQGEATPLWIACKEGHEDIVDKLIKAGANIEAEEDGITPLWEACYYGYKEVVEVLLSAGANIEAVNWYGSTPLYIACQEGYKEVVEVLLKAGADGEMLLHEAYQFGIKEVAEMLIDNFVDLTVLPTNRDDELISWLLESSSPAVRARVAFYVRDIECLRKSLVTYYNQYRAEYENTITKDLQRFKDNIDELYRMVRFARKLKDSTEYKERERELEDMLVNLEVDRDKVKSVEDLLSEVNRFVRDVNNVHNTKIIESVILPLKRRKKIHNISMETPIDKCRFMGHKK